MAIEILAAPFANIPSWDIAQWCHITFIELLTLSMIPYTTLFAENTIKLALFSTLTTRPNNFSTVFSWHTFLIHRGKWLLRTQFFIMHSWSWNAFFSICPDMPWYAMICPDMPCYAMICHVMPCLGTPLTAIFLFQKFRYRTVLYLRWKWMLCTDLLCAYSITVSVQFSRSSGPDFIVSMSFYAENVD